LAWQKAKEVTRIVLRISGTSWKPQFAAVFSQLQRSSLSVQMNIAEGYAYSKSASFRNHLRIAYASAIETDDLLDLMSEYDHFDRSDLTEAVNTCRESQKLLLD